VDVRSRGHGREARGQLNTKKCCTAVIAVSSLYACGIPSGLLAAVGAASLAGGRAFRRTP